MGVKALRLQSISECEMAGLKVFLALSALPPPAPSSWRGNRSRGSFPQMSLGTSETAASLQPSARSLGTRRLGHLRPSVANQNASNSSLAGWLRRSLTVDLLSI